WSRPPWQCACTYCHEFPGASMSITFARFENPIEARKASQLLRERLSTTDKVELLRSARRLSHHIIPLRLTAARIGTLLGGICVAVLSVMAASAGLWVMTSSG